MPEIKRVELERENHDGVHEVSKGARLEPVDPAPVDPAPVDPAPVDQAPVEPARVAPAPPAPSRRGVEADEEFDRATTPFPGG